MRQYHVTGMSCAACSARVERAVNRLEGVEKCSVSLLTNSMKVEGDVAPETVIAAVEDAGYGISVKNAEDDFKNDEELRKKQSSAMLRRLLVSIGFLLVIVYISMGFKSFGWPLPSIFTTYEPMAGISLCLLTIIVMIINRAFFISGFKSIIRRSPNMDALVSLGASASFIYSLWVLIEIIIGTKTVENADYYFESAAMILTFITIGKFLESVAKGKTTSALKGLIDLTPQKAVVIRDGKEVSVDIKEVALDDIFVVRPGDSIPADGVVVEGSGAIDESSLTGESIPCDKEVGDEVSAATVNQSGYLKCRVTRVGEDTLFAGIIQMVRDASSDKPPISKAADKISGIFVPVVISLGILVTLIWLGIGESVGVALSRGISVLVVSCPCALGLATPVAVMVGNGVAAKRGILFKTAAAIEETGAIKNVAFDKTGTLSSGKPAVTDVKSAEGIDENTLIKYAVSLEKKSEHPLAKAVCQYAEDEAGFEVDQFRAHVGCGVSGSIDGKVVYGGKYAFVSEHAEIPDEAKKMAESMAETGKTPLYFAKEDEYLGFVAVSDVLREDSIHAVKALREMGVDVAILTGDAVQTAKYIGGKLGVEKVYGGILPDQKAGVVKDLQKTGKVAMVGDGINDAPALTSADIGIAIGAGSDIAVDAADVVLVKNRPCDVPKAIAISRSILRIIHQNLFWALFYNMIGIPVAAGVFVSFGLALNPEICAAAMGMSSFCVVSNALRLNWIKIDKIDNA